MMWFSSKKSCAAGMLSMLLVVGTAKASTVSGPFTVLVATTPETYYVITGSSGATYDLLQQASWTSDQAEAQALGTNLITIGSATQNTTVLGDVAQNFSASVPGLNLTAVPLWLGLNDQAHDPAFGGTDDGPGGASSTHASDFSWVDGSSSTYRNWNTATNEPTDTSPDEYYTAINWHYAQSTSSAYGTWNDTPNAGSSGFGGNTGSFTGYYGIAAAVPEPTSLGLLVFATTALLGRRGRR